MSSGPLSWAEFYLIPLFRPSSMKGVLFDQDGTLYRFVSGQDGLWRQLTAEFIQTRVGGDAEAWLIDAKRRFKSYSAAIKAEGLYDEYERTVYLDPRLEPTRYHAPDARLAAVLTKLRSRGLRLGVVSTSPNGASHFVDRTLDALGVRKLFDCVVSGSDVPVPKPDPIHFRAAAELLRIDCADLVFVGDELEKDVLPAVSLGMSAALVLDDGRRKPETRAALLERARACSVAAIDSIYDLPDLLLQKT